MESCGIDSCFFFLFLSKEGDVGVIFVILLLYVVFWMYLRDGKKLGYGDIVGILIKLYVIFFCVLF